MSRIRISRTILLAALAASLMLILPAPASARVHVGIGFYGGPVYPYWGGYWGPGPYWGGPYWGGGYWGGPWGYPYGYGGYGRPMGEVHIKSPDPKAEIYINGSYAGSAHHLKHFYLRPGKYLIEQRIGSDVQKTRIYVLADRNVNIQFGPPGAGQPEPQRPPESGAPPPPPPDQGDYPGD